ncbi:MetQ/NlpA family ABC transporter substrate-binding protein [Liquorilactobacillus satsumensis]|uniref:MetQ/NlpA family ABC transporter substrate-binding protein n=1 Tax=Liquorilactobacillus satsumensis TaxID=259059 RepID=UPI0006D03B94|nr:MetQ/NlpA family ABC transporter substrate-binding protein [Liquorilactobacillus satsumensis]MCC7666083.1 metal ABC transporter substrate-binding protein [Liquorilactobacillus satsumensis]MCP9312537.1 metal ABC transporter substrate-binding protein [Liquorilactobacillus satsumensis]MCP9328840.1 metal ABC transporter substrate-binding protein [Liquorilactobacillus satsumensis]MCP9356810.1 metal ABC transporter substrate-binding protein [Liquorilactobacillus satsumensis]MCP9360499.1 metal ABC
MFKSSRFKLSVTLLVVLLIAVLAFFTLHGQKSSSNNQKTILLGSSPGPYSELFLKGIKPILEKEGYHVTNKSFNNLLNADVALSEGQVDLSVDQHTAYMKNFNTEKKANLVALTPIPTVPTGIYPAQKITLKNVAFGDRIAIPNDPANTARAYNLLVKAGWITLKKGTDLIKATKKDIATNKYNLKITEMDSATIPRSKQDFEYVVLPGSVAYSAKISTKKILLAETLRSEYRLVAVTTKKNAKTAWAKAVKKAYQSTEFKNYVKQHNNDNYWVLPNN